MCFQLCLPVLTLSLRINLVWLLVVVTSLVFIKIAVSNLLLKIWSKCSNCHYSDSVSRIIRRPIPTILKDIKSIDWQRIFISKSVNKQVFLFNWFILNIFDNYVPDKLVTINDQDQCWAMSSNQNYLKTRKSTKLLLRMVKIPAVPWNYKSCYWLLLKLLTMVKRLLLILIF